MTGSAASRTRPPLRPLRGAEWFAARLALAIRRTRRFTRWWIGVGGSITMVALLLPIAAGDPVMRGRKSLDRVAADTLRLGARMQVVQDRISAAESALADAMSGTPRLRLAPAPQGGAARDSRIATLDRAIATARIDVSMPALLALADHPLLRDGPRMRALADSLRRTTDLTEVRPLGSTILAMAETRRATLASQLPNEAVPAPTYNMELAVDTVALRANLRALRDSATQLLTQQQAVRDTIGRRARALAAQHAEVPPQSPGLVMLVVLLLGVVVRVGTVLTREMREPTLAHGREAERAVGAPALATVRDAIPDGPLRFRPSGVDPFRVLYLALTSTGTRTRSVLVTGEDTVIAAVAAARLAIAAAADHRRTLVAEIEPEYSALARIFRHRPEPGFTDAMAGTLPWREVARPVGLSDGLTIQMLPAGSVRGEERVEGMEAQVRAAFTEFQNAFEFTILVVALHDVARGRALLPGAPLVLCGTLGETPVAEFTAIGARVQEGTEKLHSVVIWDAPRPILPSRTELSAFLSKQKGRTPTGSFTAV